MKKNLVFLFSSLVYLGLVSSCSTKEAIPTPEVLGSYLDYTPVQQPKTDDYAAYFDFSDGMLDAYSDPATQRHLKSIVNKITGTNKCKSVYELKKSSISLLDKSQTELYNYIFNKKSYAQCAPIESTLQQIVSENKSALLITDFEEYTNGKVQRQNYAKKYFVDWLNKGYDVTFFVFDYQENNKDKHLYLTVFDDVKHSLLNDVKQAMEGNDVNYKQFNLTANTIENVISCTNNYMSSTKGGCYHESENNVDIASCTNEDGIGDCFTNFTTHNAEYYPFGDTWPNIVSNAKSLMEEGNSPVFTHLLSGVTVDMTAMSGYDVKSLKIKVYNIQKDFEKYTGYYDFQKNKENSEYVDENGNLSLAYDYSKGGIEPIEIQDVFVNASSVKDNKATLAIDFNKAFMGNSANIAERDLLRIDVMIDQCEVKSSLLADYFSWLDNDNLEQAIKNTLQEYNPQGKIIYTYYVRAY